MQVQKIQAGETCRNKGNRCTVQQVREQGAGNRRAGAGSGHGRESLRPYGRLPPYPFFLLDRLAGDRHELSKKLLITEFIKLRVYASLATSGR